MGLFQNQTAAFTVVITSSLHPFLAKRVKVGSEVIGQRRCCWEPGWLTGALHSLEAPGLGDQAEVGVVLILVCGV